MSGKLDKSLDDLVKTQRANRRVRRGPKGSKPTSATAAPIGGVKKAVRAVKPAAKAAIPIGPSGAGDSKIIVSNLPQDVTEAMMKEYFHKTISPVKRVVMSYGPNGRSRGICTVTFSKKEAAAKAVQEMNGVKVDNSPMKVEIVLNAGDAPAPTAAKSLKDRISQPKPAKAQPKPATATKPAAGKAGNAKGKRGRNGRVSKPKKTAEELDAEMADYFDGGATNGGDAAMSNGAATQPAANGGDVGMEDEIQ